MQTLHNDSLSGQYSNVFSPGADLDYFRSRVFVGVETNINYTLESLMKTSWQHPKQLIVSDYVDGCFILDSLVEGLNSAEVDDRTTYRCRNSDGIQGHLGVTILEYLRRNWQELPSVFKEWANDKRLYVAADTFWGDDGHIYIPVLISASGKPDIRAVSPNSLAFDKKDVFLKV